MSSSPSTLRSTLLAIALSSVLALIGCGSKLIRLGDQTASVSSGGSAGTGGDSGATVAGTGATGGEVLNQPGADGGAAGSGEPCAQGQVLASEVLWIGDSWIQIPNGTQHNRVRDLARAAGALASDEDYVNVAAAAANMAAVAKQYDTRESGATKVKVLLMDGGTWDPIAAQMAGASVSTAIDDSIGTFQQFLDKVASDGTVEHIVYFLVPELPTIPGVSSMRPRLQQACDESAVPCHFIDLQPYWQGHPEYTAADGIQASEAGATLIGDLIWDAMQEHCIAQ